MDFSLDEPFGCACGFKTYSGHGASSHSCWYTEQQKKVRETNRLLNEQNKLLRRQFEKERG